MVEQEQTIITLSIFKSESLYTHLKAIIDLYCILSLIQDIDRRSLIKPPMAFL